LALVPSPAPTAATAFFPKGIKTEVLQQGSQIVRIHHCDNEPMWFGPKPGSSPAYRFDAPSGQYRVMYAAAAIDGSFVETILHGRAADQIIKRSYVELRAWTTITLRRPLLLMKLYDEGLFWHRTDASVSAAHDYAEPRRIALAAFLECPTLDGLTYRSRHNNGELCYALFDRVQTDDLEPDPKQRFRDHPTELDALMGKYGAVFDTSPAVPPISLARDP
jgi:RES domain